MNQSLELNSFSGYDPGGFYDEMFEADGSVRPEYAYLLSQIEMVPRKDFTSKQHAAERALLSMGITFNVYSENEGVERIMPIDILPRIITGSQWRELEEGLIQRVTALNLFIDDLYHEQKVIKDGIIPRHVIESSKSFLPQCKGLNPPRGIWCHITGSDLIRDGRGQF
ncbi:MAG TPA: circularly permuted type 2 ATP-grasp protein, partial [Saprospiraceae bacterium]|nr:circularly permuted type 2 ATP-grasp protein [Saprospiraceae bacterium]